MRHSTHGGWGAIVGVYVLEKGERIGRQSSGFDQIFSVAIGNARLFKFPAEHMQQSFDLSFSQQKVPAFIEYEVVSSEDNTVVLAIHSS